MTSRRSFHRDFKLALCQEIESGLKTKAQACREHSLSPSLLDRWMEQYRQRGPDAFPNSSGIEEVS
jgi:transposase